MPARILWQDIWSLEGFPSNVSIEPLYELLNEFIFKKVARDDTKLEIRHPKRSSFMVMSPYLELLNTSGVIEGIIQAEAEGFDAAIIGCGNDPGLYEAREAVSIPVVGPTETAMHIACFLGGKFAVITIVDRLIPFVERNLKLYGLQDRAISRRPVRTTDPGIDFIEFFKDPGLFLDQITTIASEHIIPSFEKEAKECIAEGAEVIVTACCILGPLLTMAGYNKVRNTEVPVIDCASVAIKMAELLSDIKKTLGISTSKALTYRSLPKEIMDKMSKPFTVSK